MRGKEFGKQWFVSWHNAAGSGQLDTAARKFLIHDVTLRDGEQQAGVLFTQHEKIEIAKALDRLGVDRIEAGMVAVSEEDRDTIRHLVGIGLRSEIWTIARSTVQDIEHAVKTGAAGVGIIILANEQYCKVFRWSVDDAIAKAMHAAEVAKAGGMKTTLLLADSSRMELPLLEKIVRAASSGPYDAIALMDTFGALSPAGARHLVSTVRSISPLEIELHPHNDFGMGAGVALAGVEAGASVVHTSALGLGERLGNAPLEEVAVGARLLYGLEHNLDLSQLRAVTDMVQQYSGVTAAPNKPIIGNSYTQIESGTVATEYTRLRDEGDDLNWMFPFQPDLIGPKEVELVIGKGSGMANIESMLEELHLEMDPNGKRNLLMRSKDASIARHRLLTREEFSELAVDGGARRRA